MPAIRLLVLAGDPLARAGLALQLAPWSEVSVVGTAAPADLDRPHGSGHSPIDLFAPEALLWDLGADPQAALAQLDGLDTRLSLPVVFLLPGPTRLAIRHLQGVFTHGGWSLLRREADPAALVHALTSALDGLAVIDPLLIPVDERPAAERAAEPAPVELLTPRELQVLKLIAEGYSNKQIGQALGVRENTIKFHVNAILGKLNAASRTEAVTRAARLGWLAL